MQVRLSKGSGCTRGDGYGLNELAMFQEHGAQYLANLMIPIAAASRLALIGNEYIDW